jgi:PilZ domain
MGSWPVQRRFPRFRTDLPITVRDPLEHEFEGHCNVFAEGGLAAIFPEEFPVGSVVLLRFMVPTHPTELRVLAEVRYHIGFLHGLEFVSLNEEDRRPIQQFCSHLSIVEGSQ